MRKSKGAIYYGKQNCNSHQRTGTAYASGILAKAVAAHKDCKVTLHANGKTIAAKAVMQIMAACMKKGCEVEIVCDGANEQAVLDEISKLFEDGFGE